MKAYLQKLFKSQNLTRDEAQAATTLIMQGGVSVEEIAGFLGALAGKGETVDEIVGCASTLRAHAVPLQPKRRDLIDVCGTGGDGAETFNISTCNALVLAAAGLGVCKHGNRAVSSRCGSADVLEALGITIDMQPDRAASAIDSCGFAFLFAPHYHPAMKHVGPVRRALGVRTVFNLLGPLANPAPVKHQVLGVFDPDLVPMMAEALQKLGTEAALVVCGDGGLDELSLSGPSRVSQLKDGNIQHLSLSPEDFGLSRAPLETLKGGDKEANARIVEAVLRGERSPRRDIVVMNAGAALVISGRAHSWRDGAEQIATVIDSGRAYQTLEKIRAFA
ncbi:MAG TPA: anthranilate phosphoribosyltransferase [Oligoflexus sp.]|uniref:anthranilate phosphoribosyltransferase n=1 Tax=Oligoflexus sp. TaxID=1971216 RepID=UPI002D3D5F3F|nr:anthranilate phosphoribosyltransferase [Oligoflexus sp.]HYX38859.1 anthranilate phosphoribosyltransferase [Oligoflexus sp.]